MKCHDSPDNLEKDPVWELLRQSPSLRPGPNFASNVVRAARVEETAQPWWSRLWIPASIGGVLAASAAVVAVVFTLQSQPKSDSGIVVTGPADSSLAELQDDYETEVFIAASEHLASYSDEELVSMIGF